MVLTLHPHVVGMRSHMHLDRLLRYMKGSPVSGSRRASSEGGGGAASRHR